jgi:hypothetical protein
MNERFAKLIKYLIAEGIIKNQGEASAFFGYNSKTTISNIINSKAKMPPKLLLLIEAKLPNVSMQWLKIGQGQMFNQPSSYKYRFENISPRVQEQQVEYKTSKEPTQALEQRIKDLEQIISTQKDLLANKDKIITLLENKNR